MKPKWPRLTRRSSPVTSASANRKGTVIEHASCQARSQRHKKRRTVLNRAKGYYGAKSRSYRAAKEQVQHSLQYMYRDRRNKKREIRRLWITRINAAARINGMSYSVLMNGLKKAGVQLDRKVLSDMAINDPAAFTAITEVAKKAL